jgi:hypothetical protein
MIMVCTFLDITLKTYLRKKMINNGKYFYELTPFWDREKKKIRYHRKYLEFGFYG